MTCNSKNPKWILVEYNCRKGSFLTERCVMRQSKSRWKKTDYLQSSSSTSIRLLIDTDWLLGGLHSWPFCYGTVRLIRAALQPCAHTVTALCFMWCEDITRLQKWWEKTQRSDWIGQNEHFQRNTANCTRKQNCCWLFRRNGGESLLRTPTLTDGGKKTKMTLEWLACCLGNFEHIRR